MVLNAEQIPHINRNFANSSWLDLEGNNSNGSGGGSNAKPPSTAESAAAARAEEPTTVTFTITPVEETLSPARTYVVDEDNERGPEHAPLPPQPSLVQEQHHHNNFDTAGDYNVEYEWYDPHQLRTGDNYSPHQQQLHHDQQHYASRSSSGVYLSDGVVDTSPSPLWSSANVFEAHPAHSAASAGPSSGGHGNNGGANMFFGNLPWKELLVNERSNSRGSIYSSGSSEQDSNAVHHSSDGKSSSNQPKTYHQFERLEPNPAYQHQHRPSPSVDQNNSTPAGENNAANGANVASSPPERREREEEEEEGRGGGIVPKD